MPITYPPSLSSLGLVPYNINPHYNEFVPLNYRGESRVDRLIEFVRYSQKPVLAIGEGAVVHVSNGKHLILASSDDILVKLFVPDPEKNNGVAIQQVSIGEDVLPKLKPYL